MFKKKSLLHNYNGIHHISDMRKRHLDVGDAYLCYKIFGSSGNYDYWLAEFIVAYFNFIELQTIAPAGANSFQEGLFCCKARGIMLGFVFLGLAVSNFSDGEQFFFQS